MFALLADPTRASLASELCVCGLAAVVGARPATPSGPSAARAAGRDPGVAGWRDTHALDGRGEVSYLQ
jgi:hypothetical protein